MRFIVSLVASLCLTSLMLSPAVLAYPSISMAQQQALGIQTTPPIADDVHLRTTVIGVIQQAPNARLNIAKPYGLQIKQLLIKVGDRVQQGQVLATIYVPELQRLEHLYHNAISSAQLLAQKQHREAQLVKEGIIASKQYELTQMEYQQAQENLQSYLSQLTRKGLTPDELALLKDPKNRHLDGVIGLSAPTQGIIQQIHVTIGDSVDANHPLMTLLTSNALTVTMPLTQQQLGNIQLGQQLRLMDGTPIQVINIQNTLSDAQKVLVTASLEHASLRSGQRVEVGLDKDDQETPLWRVPRQAIVYLNNTPHLLVIKQHSLQAHPVSLIRATRDGWVVGSNQLFDESAIIISGTAAAKALLTEADTR